MALKNLVLLLSLSCACGVWSAKTGLEHDSVSSDLNLIATVAQLTKDLQHLQVKVSTLEKLEARVTELENQLKQKHGKCSDANEDNAEVANGDEETAKKELKEEVSRDGEASLRRGIRQTPESVAFSAVLSKRQQHLTLHQPIKCDQIITNIGHGYNPNSGVFTAPSPGTYLFLYHLGHHSTGETWVEIKKNGLALNGLAIEGTQSRQNLQGSNSVVLALEAGDEVWVEVYHVNDVYAQEFFTTFTGVLIP